MKKGFTKFAALSFTGIFTVALASADTLKYNTSGSFFAPVSGLSADKKTITLADGFGAFGTLVYYELLSTTITVPPLNNISYGYFALAYTGSHSISFPALTFNLVINDETDPLPPVTIVGHSSASTATATNSNLTFFFTPLSVNEGNILLTITSPTQIPPSSSFDGQASIQGTANSNPSAPEPATVSMLGISLVGIGFAARHRLRK